VIVLLETNINRMQNYEIFSKQPAVSTLPLRRQENCGEGRNNSFDI